MENVLDDLVYDIYRQSPSLIEEGGVVAQFVAMPLEYGTLIEIYKQDGNVITEFLDDYFIEQKEVGLIFDNEDMLY